MITAVDLLRGLALLAGWDRMEVEGATGYLDTNYAGKGRAGVEALQKYDIVCVHIEAPDEASHEGRADAKVAALEAIDTHIVAPLWQAVQALGDAESQIGQVRRNRQPGSLNPSHDAVENTQRTVA